MTHDEVVLFSAVKLDISLILYPSWKGGAKYGYLRDECLVPFDLSSPELMLKGMGVCPHNVIIYTDDVHIKASETVEAFAPFDRAKDIPIAFWQCWAEMEYANRPYTKEELDDAEREANELGKKIGWE